ncbi:MAG: response regulator/GGDEF domain-containing protein [Nitrospirae bacterium]|nr:MAG: response regulator/GGDEF domain-containing protein [Nitrospirota bacterium]
MQGKNVTIEAMAKAKILLVEDSKVQAGLVRDFLEKTGYEVIWAENGKSAIKTAKTMSVDIILLDLMLPDISGNEVCRWLKLNENTRGIPIIMLTAKDAITDKVAGLEAGADDYLPKPYNEIELNARIYASLRTKALQDELKQKNRQLENLLKQVEIMAITDQLTGIYNRRRLVTILEKEFRRTVRYKSPLTCLMIDIDHFKRINDKFSHHTGDMVIKETAQIITECAREIDTVARWGGEEFIALFPQTKKEDALQSAVRIIKKVSEHKFPEISNERITISIGIASVPDPSIDTEEKLIHASDMALYKAKKNGRNRAELG